MSGREKLWAILIAGIVVGYGLWSFAVEPVVAAFDQIETEAASLEQDLIRARALVDNEAKLRKRMVGYERAGLSRTLNQADAQTGGALLAWAEQAGLEKINLSDAKAKADKDKPFGELIYTLQTAGSLQQVYDLLWSLKQSPFAIRVEKCVIDLRNDQSDQLQLSLTVSTLFDKESPQQ